MEYTIRVSQKTYDTLRDIIDMANESEYVIRAMTEDEAVSILLEFTNFMMNPVGMLFPPPLVMRTLIEQRGILREGDIE